MTKLFGPTATQAASGLMSSGDKTLLDSIPPSLDGYASTVTELEHYNQLSQAIHDITTGLDGYALAPEVGSGSDGYVAFFVGPNAVAGDNDLFWDRENNRLGIGTSSPTVKLQVAGNISVREPGGATGSEQYGESASATGLRSTALGFESAASGNDSTSLGRRATSTASRSIAIGLEANFGIASVGTGSIAIGGFTQTPAIQATAIADGAFAMSNGSIAIGPNAGTGYTDNTKTHQTVIGNGARGNSHRSIAVGIAANAGDTNVNATSAIAIGDTSKADGVNSIALGTSASATKSNAFAIGASAVTSADNQGVFGNSVTPIDLVNFGSLGLGTPSTAQNFKLEVAGNIGPNVDDAYSLGSLAFRWMDGYFGPGTLHFVQNVGENDLGVNRDWTINIDSAGNFRIKQAADNFAILRADTSNSMAIGQGATAQFDNSVVVGHSATMGGASTAQTDNVVIGRGANTNISGSNAGNAVVIGSGATVTRENAVAVGQGSSASAASVAIGRSANALSGIAIGASAIHNDAAGSNLVIGTSSSVTGGTTIMLGSGSQCSSGTGLVIGHATFLGASRSNSIVIGHSIGSASIGGANSILIGTGARVGASGVAVGINANNSTGPTVATVSIGNTAQAILANTTAVGSSSSAANTGSTAIGDGAIAGHITSGTNSTAVGYLAAAGNAASVTNTTAIGQGSIASASGTTALGRDAQATNTDSIAIGRATRSGASGSINIGTTNIVNGTGAIVIGNAASGNVDSTVVIGRSASNAGFTSTVVVGGFASVGNNNATAIGNSANASASDTTALGASASAAGIQSTSLGYASISGSVTANNTTSVGYFAKSLVTNSVAVGAQSYVDPAASGIALGKSATLNAGATGAIGIGTSVSITPINVTAIGHSISVITGGTSAVVVGAPTGSISAANVTAVGTGTNIGSGVANVTAIGTAAQATNTSATSLGHNAQATNTQATALGKDSVASAANSVAVGMQATAATTTGSVAIGFAAQASGTNGTTAVGGSTTASGAQSTAIGRNATTTVTNSTAVGYNISLTTGSDNTAIGSQSGANATSATAVGSSANASSSATVSIGASSSASGTSAIAIGNNATAVGSSSVSIGQNAQAQSGANNATLIGQGIQTTNAQATAVGGQIGNNIGVSSVAVGYSSNANATTSVAIGSGANASSSHSVAVGASSVATGANGTTALGRDAQATGADSTSVGHGPIVQATNAVVVSSAAMTVTSTGSAATIVGKTTASVTAANVTGVGHNVNTGSGVADTTAIGAAAVASAANATAVGSAASAAGANGTTAVGRSASASGADATAIGRNTVASASTTTAVGFSADATQATASAFGANAQATGAGSTALGNNAQATGTDSTAVGLSAVANQSLATAIGDGATASGTNATVVGQGATASASNCVVLGQGSSATTNANSVVLGGGGHSATGGSIVLINASGTGRTHSGASGIFVGSQDANISANGMILIGHNTSWNSVGGFSVGLGDNVSTGGTAPIAIGRNAIATATDTISIGANASSTGASSISIGGSATTSSFTNSVAIGQGATATGNNDGVIGTETSAIGLRGYGLFDWRTDGYFDGYLMPFTDNVHWLGTPNKRWNSLFVGPGSLHLSQLPSENDTGVDRDWNLSIDSSGKFTVRQDGDIKLQLTENDLLVGGRDVSGLGSDTTTLQMQWAGGNHFAIFRQGGSTQSSGIIDGANTYGGIGITNGNGSTILRGIWVNNILISSNFGSAQSTSINSGGLNINTTAAINWNSTSFTSGTVDFSITKDSPGVARFNNFESGTQYLMVGHNLIDGYIGTNTGNIRIAPADNIVKVDGYIIPEIDDAYGLGNEEYRWRDLYLGPGSLHLTSKDTDGGRPNRTFSWSISEAGVLTLTADETTVATFDKDTGATFPQGGGISATQGFDGYIAFFTGTSSIAGDGDLFFNRETHALTLGGGGNLTVSSGNAIISGTTTIGAAYGGTPFALYDDLVVQGTDTSGITIGSGNTSFGAILFADADSNLAGNIIFEHSTDQLQLGTAGSTRIYLSTTGLTVNTGNRLIVPSADAPTAPTIAFGDGDTGFYELADDIIQVSTDGQRRWTFSVDDFRSANNDGPTIQNEQATATNPVFAFRFDLGTGLGHNAAGQVSIIGNSIEVARATNGGSFDQFIISPDGVQNNSANPSLAFGDADSGFYELADDNINVSIGGTAQYQWSGDTFRGLDNNGPKFRNIPATGTQPNIFPNSLDTDTGIGSANEDNISLIVAGYEALRITGNATNISATVDAYGDLLLHNNTRITNSDEVLNLGAMANTSHSLGINDVIVGGSLEVESSLWVDGTAHAVAYNGPSGLVFVQTPIVFHSGEQSPILAANHTFDQWGIFTGNQSGNQIVVASQVFYNSRDFDHEIQGDPTIFIHSNTDPDVDNSQWLGLWHDKAKGHVETGLGPIVLAPYDGYVLPAADDAYSLGSQNFRWQELWVGPGSLHLRQNAAENDAGIEREWTMGINSEGGIFIKQANDNFIASGITSGTLTIGLNALAFAGPRNTAIGSNVNINNVNGNNTGIGYNAFIEAGNGVAIGTNATISGTGSHSTVVIGPDADAASSQAVVIGYSASIGAGFNSTIAIGYNSSISGTNAISIGPSAGASQNAISIGHSGTVGAQSIAIGIGTANGSTEAIVFGYSSQSGANESVTIGVNSLTNSGTGNGTGSVAIGSGAQSDGGGIAIGKGAIANNTSVGSRSVAIGYGATTGTFTNALALGADATVTANNEGQIGTAGQPLSIKTYGPMTIGGTDVGLRRGAAGILEISDGGAVNFGTLRMGAVGTTINSSGAVTFGAALHQMNDGGALAWGGNGANGTIWYIDHSMAQLAFYLGSDISRSLVIGSRAAYAQDFDHAVQTDPALFIHSATAPDTDNTQWIGLQHNKLDGYIYTGTGDLVLAPFGANVVPGSATTGLGEFDNRWADGYFTDLNTKGVVAGIVNIESIDSPYLARQDDHTIIVDATGGVVTVFLPSAGGANKGRIYNIKKIDATNNVDIQASGLETIDGAGTVTLTTQYKSRQIQSDGSNWHVIGGVF